MKSGPSTSQGGICSLRSERSFPQGAHHTQGALLSQVSAPGKRDPSGRPPRLSPAGQTLRTTGTGGHAALAKGSHHCHRVHTHPPHAQASLQAGLRGLEAPVSVNGTWEPGRQLRAAPCRGAARREPPAPPHPAGRCGTPGSRPYPAAHHHTLRFAPAAGSKKAPARSPPRRGAPPASASAGSPRPCARRGSEPVQREGRGGVRSRGTRGRNPRGLRSRITQGAGGKPLALLSRDPGQGPSCCLAHTFLPGARPGSLRRVESPWLVLISGQ